MTKMPRFCDDLVGLGRRRAVGALGDEPARFGWILFTRLAGHLVLDGRRDEDVDFLLDPGVARQHLVAEAGRPSSCRSLPNWSVMPMSSSDRRRPSCGRCRRSGRRWSQQETQMTLPPSLVKRSNGVLRDVAEALDRRRGLGDVDAEHLEGLADRVDDAVAGRLGPSERAAHADRLAGDEAGVLGRRGSSRTRRASRACAAGWSSRRGPGRPGRARCCGRSGAPSRGRCAPARACSGCAGRR